jgi:lipid-binding SYLF domain-containing protein
MIKSPLLATFSLLALVLTSTSDAATREEKRVADASDVIDQLLRIPEKSIPPTLLARAYAVAVIPNVVKAAFGLGARRGKGILVVRQGDSSWSNPAFVTLTGGSFGWQIGAQSTDTAACLPEWHLKVRALRWIVKPTPHFTVRPA